MDFIASNDSTNTAGLTWSMVGDNPQYSNFSMINSLTAPLQLQQEYTALPSTLPKYVGQLAEQVTRGSHSRFEQVVRLQDWFRTKFRYSLKTPEGDGSDALMRFLAPTKDGRVGYCEQFASAFAVMARTLHIPARVAIGFLSPQKTGKDTFVFSSHDMHAWPEVYFRGSGWVKFEPTPAQRTGAAPTYTTAKVTKPHNPKNAGPSGGGRFTTDPASASASKVHDKNVDSTGTSSSHFPWVTVVVVLLVLVLLAAACVVPAAVRRSRRRRRLEGGAEDAWRELRDTAVDLGVAWPMSRSPQETGYLLSAWFGPEPDGAPLVRPPRGRGLDPRAEGALDRIVLLLERVRYARYADDPPGLLAEDVTTCIAALEHGSTRGALRRARWFPRSLFVGRRAAARAELDREPESVNAGGVVDHVG
jgi:hypothetical protein